ncbi:MAG TPA: hypothetical protein VI322_02985 [Candidatus Saccharimonadia bacterium]
MTVPSRNLITKGIFAVSIVAATAVVGAIGYAQAQRGGLGAGDGYGGTGEQIRAAIAEFQSAVSDAQNQLTSDINACLGQSANDPTASPTANARTSLWHNNAAAIGSLKSFMANPARVSDSGSVLNRDLTSRSNQVNAALDTNTSKFVDSMNNDNNFAVDSNKPNHGQELQQCLHKATNNFRSAVHDAQQTLMHTLHDILHG